MTVIEERTGIHAPIERCFDLARSVEVHLLGNIHYGEQAVATGGVTTGLVGLGERVTWRAKHFGLWRQLTSEITQLERPVFFQAAQVHGIFRYMRQNHFFRPLSPDRTEMRDVFAFAAPIPILGRLAEIAILARYMRALLRERSAVIKGVAESSEWTRYLT